jgi:hypothetical protein
VAHGDEQRRDPAQSVQPMENALIFALSDHRTAPSRFSDHLMRPVAGLRKGEIVGSGVLGRRGRAFRAARGF